LAAIAVSSSSPAGSPTTVLRALVAWATDPHSWRRIVYLTIALPLGITYFVIIAAGLSTGLGVAIMTFGLPVVIMIWVWRTMARLERLLCSRLLGVDVPEPYRTPEGGWFSRLLGRLGDPATWKDLAYLIVHLPLSIIDFAAVAILLGFPLSLVAAPIAYALVPGGVNVGLLTVDSAPVAFAALLAGLFLLPIAVRAASAFAVLHATFARMMLTAPTDPEVATLRSSQARIIAAADAERRRLERDLHDGAQQRLVAIALQLRMARDRLARGDDALELVSGAADEARTAIAELRDLARGIHPAVLTERGLSAALRDVVARASVPVDLLEVPAGRFPSTIEASAYFVVSEALANVAKYADASRATVRVVEREDDTLVVEVCDDGRGGADPSRGSGLRGLRDRVGALNGTLTVDSPPGGPTKIRACLPAEIVDDEQPESERGVVFDERTAAIMRLRRRRGLLTHVAIFGVVELALIVIWAVGGFGYFWPGWTIFGWGLILALHASLAILRQPITELAVTREQGESAAAG
jgi:signal transduction histidine kinase